MLRLPARHESFSARHRKALCYPALVLRCIRLLARHFHLALLKLLYPNWREPKTVYARRGRAKNLIAFRFGEVMQDVFKIGDLILHREKRSADRPRQ